MTLLDRQLCWRNDWEMHIENVVDWEIFEEADIKLESEVEASIVGSLWPDIESFGDR